MLGELGQCHCRLGHAHQHTPNPTVLAAPLSKIPPGPRPCSAPLATPWDMSEEDTEPMYFTLPHLGIPLCQQLQPGDRATHMWVEGQSITPAAPFFRAQNSGTWVHPPFPSLSSKTTCSEDPQGTQDKVAKWLRYAPIAQYQGGGQAL